MGVQETICTRCAHLKMCKYKDYLLELLGKIETIEVDTPHRIEVKCDFYQTFTRENGIIV